MLSFVSYTFINADMNDLFPLIQFIFLLLYIYLVMKVSLVNALIMFFTGYIVFGLVQTCVIAGAMHLEFITEQLKPATTDAYFIQAVSIVLMLLLSFFIVNLKGGFSFIEARSRFSRKSFTGNNRAFIIFIIIAFMITLVTNIYFLRIENPPYLEIASIFLVLLIIFFYLTIRRDESNDRGYVQSSRSKTKEN